MKTKKERSFGLDLVRVIATIFVILVHSFGNTNFNSANMTGISMFLLLMIRCLVFINVLLFIILTGYCKSNKIVSKDHYYTIKKILVTYFIISIITILFRIFYLHDSTSLYNYIIGIFNFSTIPYAWYIEMYIGLFLIIPFMNILYKNLETKRQKQILIVSLLFMSCIPQTLTMFSISGYSLDVLPCWWGSVYPILLYYIGCYIKEYQLKINKVINIIFIISLTFLQAFVIYFYCQGNSLNQMLSLDYTFLPAILLSILVFILLYDVQIKGYVIKNIFSYISKLTFGLYLFSYIYDKLIYDILQFNLPINITSILGIVLYTPIIFILSLISSSILNFIINMISNYIRALKQCHDEKYK